jgi:hypothetical protein
MRKITCHCDQVFNADIPELVNLDNNPEVIARIQDGSFLACVCPSCNAELHTDLKTRFEWPSRKTNLVLIPEIERLSCLSGNLEAENDAQVVIGFAELSDRITVLSEFFDPVIIETIKYHLALKARETAGDLKLVILFDNKQDNGDLVFHIHGLKSDEMAVTKVPGKIYKTIQQDFLAHPETEPYASLRNGSWISVQNILIEDSTND